MAEKRGAWIHWVVLASICAAIIGGAKFVADRIEKRAEDFERRLKEEKERKAVVWTRESALQVQKMRTLEEKVVRLEAQLGAARKELEEARDVRVVRAMEEELKRRSRERIGGAEAPPEEVIEVSEPYRITYPPGDYHLEWPPGSNPREERLR
jgi:hypothetical protein